MTDEQIANSIKTGELQLGFGDKTTHYEVVGVLFLIPTMFLCFYLYKVLQGSSIQLHPAVVLGSLVSTLLGLNMYRLQKRRLKLTIVDTTLTRDEIVRIMEPVATELEWMPEFWNDQVIIATTAPGFWAFRPGERITILFDENRMLVNSINDPSGRGSIDSYARNRRNVTRLLEEIEKASHNESHA